MKNNYQNSKKRIFKIYPAIDLKEGKAVRLYQGDMNNCDIYNKNPLDQAKIFADNGFKYLHIVDLDNACNKGNNLKLISDIINKTDLNIEIGGGVNSLEIVKKLLDLGANNIIIGSLLIKNPELTKEILTKYENKISLAIDVRKRLVAIDGWKTDTKIKDIDLLKQYQDFKIFSIIYTDIDKDGMMAGPNLEYMAEFSHETSFNITASGGVANISDIEKIYNLNNKFNSVIIGRALYEHRITIKELQKFL